MVARAGKYGIGKFCTFEFQSVCMLGIVCIFGNHILAVAFLEDVGVGTVISAIQPVVSQTAMQDVFPVSSVQYVVSFSACNKVGKFVAIKRIVFFRTGFMAEFFHRFFAQGFGVLFECAAVDGIQRILRHQR